MSGPEDREQTPMTTPPTDSGVPAHAPGPWRVLRRVDATPDEHDMHWDSDAPNSAALVVDALGEPVADVWGDHCADLIAAAPDLLDALRRLDRAARAILMDSGLVPSRVSQMTAHLAEPLTASREALAQITKGTTHE